MAKATISVDVRGLPAVKAYIEGLEQTLAMIGYCDVEDHEYFEPHGLYRSHMMQMARSALGDTPDVRATDPYD